MNEALVKKEVKAYLNQIGAYHIWPIPTGYGPPLIDCYACVNGLFVAIETKREGKFATTRQLMTLANIEKAGGLAICTWDPKGLKRLLEGYILDVAAGR